MIDRHALVRAVYAGEYRIDVEFADGLAGQVDFEGRLRGRVFEPLADRRRFRAFRVRWGTIEWASGADWAPENLRRLVLASPSRRIDSRRSDLVTGQVRPGGTVPPVPEISRFLGFVIVLRWNDHLPPHFHVLHGAGTCRVNIRTGAVIGKLGRRERRVLREWTALHRAELMENWHKARDRRPLMPVAPWRG